MVRKKLIRGEVALKTPILNTDEHGEYVYVRWISGGVGAVMIVEKDGQSYVELPLKELRICLPIKEKFDDLDGEEKTGSNASETKE